MMDRSLHILRCGAITLVLVASVTLRLAAQSPHIALFVNLGPRNLWQTEWTPTHRLFPEYVKQNPQGYSPLCRMELKIERQSPVGVWMKLDGNRTGMVANPGWASVRFKVPLAGR